MAKFPFYAAMNVKGRARFINRMLHFIDSKEFVGKNDILITEEIKILISAAAIQLTFGLKNYMLRFLNFIVVYPEKFYLEQVGAEVTGGASMSGILYLSWGDFLKGYAKPHDKYNVGLHEMAHLLKIGVLNGKDFDDKFSFYMDDWAELVQAEYQVAKKKESYLRPYAGRNKEEFFAVCVEYFFEAPIEFKTRLPDVYNHLCYLLNLDPTNAKGNYFLKENFKQAIKEDDRLIPIPEKLRASYYYHSWHWTSSILLLGFFAGGISTYFFYKYTLVSIGELFKIAAIGASLAFLTQFRYLYNNGIYSLKGFFIYLIFGLTPLFTGLFFGLNYMFKGTEHSQIIQIVQVNYFKNKIVLISATELDRNTQKAAFFDYDDYYYYQFPEVPFWLKVITADGLMGYPVINSRKVASYRSILEK